MPGEAVLGIDVGTSSTKGVLVDRGDGRIIAVAVRQHAPSRPGVGFVEMDAEQWWSECRGIAAELAAVAVLHGVRIVAVGVSGMGPCTVVTDEHDRPVGAAILYGVDTRATEQIAQLHDELDPAIVDAAGGPLTSQAVGPKLRWIEQHEPWRLDGRRRLHGVSSFIAARLTGRWMLDHHSASQCAPLYDQRVGDWSEPARALVAEWIELPPLGWPGDRVGTVTATAAEATGLAIGTPVVLGTVDAWAESVAVGAIGPGDLMLMYGTTFFLIATADRARRAPGMWSTVGVRRGTSNLAGGLATSGAVTRWAGALTGRGEAELVAAAGEVPVGSRGLLALPYFAGERTPIQDPDARGAIVGLGLEHGPAEIARALIESVALAVRHNLDVLVGSGAAVTVADAIGGGSSSEVWTRIVADATGVPQRLRRERIGASHGMAMLAAAEHGEAPIERWNPVVAVVEPDPSARAGYDRLSTRFRELYPATRDIVHALVDDERASETVLAAADHERNRNADV